MSRDVDISRRDFFGFWRRPDAEAAQSAPTGPIARAVAPDAGRLRDYLGDRDTRSIDFDLIAEIELGRCLNTLGSFCTVCVERCPVESAIVIEANIPRVNTGLCTGCGDCRFACPAPTNAISMVGRLDGL